MGCLEIREKLSAYTDGELDKRDLGAVESHLGVCANCRTELSLLGSLVSIAGRVAAIDPPAGLRERIREATTGSRAARPAVGIGEWLRATVALRWAGGVAAAGVAAVLVVMAVGSRPPVTPERTASVTAKPVASARTADTAPLASDSPAIASSQSVGASWTPAVLKSSGREARELVRTALRPKVARPAVHASPAAGDLAEPSATDIPPEPAGEASLTEPVETASRPEPAPEIRVEDPRPVRIAPVKVASAPAVSKDDDGSYISQVRAEAAMRRSAGAGGLRLYSTKF